MGQTDPKTILARNIRRLRQASGISQEELASRAQLHRTYISSVERRERNVSLENIFKIAQALGVPATVLLEDEGGA
ncbi:helix-turn-helix domain-containing protein [Sphingomonas gilva]|uniref:helix-turn-helix domain-containing protein n=1 Tax=Sphingomonas gilva TaxID=2305907 RepID=UPI0015F82B4A|nr:helix-turn-helix transcriptional regulator [Sphingomonas gilva]